MNRLGVYDFHLPPELIATTPASPRDAARLFVYDTRTDTILFDTFRNLAKHLPTPSLLVFNNTRVVPARLRLKKELGGKIGVLLLVNEYKEGDKLVKGIVDRKIAPGAKLFFTSGVYLEAARQDEQFFFFSPSVPMNVLWKLIEKEGVTPIPPYIKKTPLSERSLREKYQSVLAKEPASVAAPTASLHFTRRLLNSLQQHDIRRAEVTLHVGMGTFAPISEDNFRTKKLFAESYEVDRTAAETINTAKKSGVPVISVGTTALRTLESRAGSVNKKRRLSLTPRCASTDLFIFPPYDFKIADGLITNFHIPRSSLMLLVDAFLEHQGSRRRILDLYTIAIREQFRFYSFGDGMLIR